MSNDKPTDPLSRVAASQAKGYADFADALKYQAALEYRQLPEDFDQRARRVVVGIIGAVVGFILGYFTWAIWPVSGLIYRLFNECFL